MQTYRSSEHKPIVREMNRSSDIPIVGMSIELHSLILGMPVGTHTGGSAPEHAELQRARVKEQQADQSIDKETALTDP
jgi:hypothetical protein